LCVFLCMSLRERQRIVTHTGPSLPRGRATVARGKGPDAGFRGDAARRGVNAAKLLRACGGCLGARRR
jgi:hypothetical protein